MCMLFGVRERCDVGIGVLASMLSEYCTVSNIQAGAAYNARIVTHFLAWVRSEV